MKALKRVINRRREVFASDTGQKAKLRESQKKI